MARNDDWSAVLMLTTHTLMTHGLPLLAGCMILCSSSAALAEPLEGSLTDALTGYPVEGALVTVAGTNHTTHTDHEGKWSFDLPQGEYQIDFEANLEQKPSKVSLVRQVVPQYKAAQAHIYTSWFADQGLPASTTPMGIPTSSGALPDDAPHSIQLPGQNNPLALTVTDPIPRRIRVGRRQSPENGCSNNPVVAIEEMDIDDYVKGVLPPEIGVFQSIEGSSETYKAFGIAAKSYGLWFMLTYDESNRRTVDAPLPPNNYTWFHIDDTACNQRYSDERLGITTAAAEAVANQILVKKGEPQTLDKLEYAASCGKHGTLPEYGTTSALVPDDPTVNACAGSWCGHNTCAGHEDNPNLAGSDRCLVRGMCQWGTASWGASGKDYIWILEHYQPNLELRSLEVADASVTVQGYVYTDPNDITGTVIVGADVSLDDGQSTLSNEQGLFIFNEVPVDAGTITVTASAAGYITNAQTKMLTEGETNWVSVQLVADSADSDMGGGTGGGQDQGGQPSSSDMGSSPSTPQDQGTTPSDPTGEDENGENFDQLLTTSSGIDGGCNHTPGRSGDASWLLIAAAGLMYRRQKKN